MVDMKKEKKKKTYKQIRQMHGFLYCLPWIIGFIMFFFVPVIKTFVYSLSEIKVADEGGIALSWRGFSNFVDLFTSTITSGSHITFLQLFADENKDVLINAPIIIVFSLFLAILANMKFKGRGFVRVIFFLPIILGLDIITEMLKVIDGGDLAELRGNGLFSEGLAMFLLVKYTAIPKTIILTVTEYVDNIFGLMSQAGVQTLIYLAGLQSISPSLYEVAQIEGATAYETFWKVTFPMIGNMTVFVVVYTVVDLFLRSNIAEQVYEFAFTKSEIGISAAISIVYMLNVLLILLLILAISRKVVKSDD